MIPIKDNILIEGTPWVTLALILANVVVYVLACSHGGSLISGPDAHELVRYGAIPHRHSRWGTLFAAMFLQASIVQLAGNMLFLWLFGNTIEARLGSVKYLALYVLGGLVSLGLTVLLAPNATAPTVGAAGAVAAVLGAYLVLYPHGQILNLVLIPFFFGVAEVPALVMLGAWLAMQALFAAFGLTDPVGGSGWIAYFGDLGGLAVGALAVLPLVRREAIAA